MNETNQYPRVSDDTLKSHISGLRVAIDIGPEMEKKAAGDLLRLYEASLLDLRDARAMIAERDAVIAAVREMAVDWKTAYAMPPLPLDEMSRRMIFVADDILLELGKFATEGGE